MKLLKLSFISGLLLLLCTCKKYEDDFFWLHVTSPKDRLCRHTWKLKSYKLNYNYYPFSYQTSSIINRTIEFEKSGYSHGGASFVGLESLLNFEGVWQFDNNKKDLKIEVKRNGAINTLQIDQLDPTNLKLHNDSIEFTFKK